ncbi:carboxypeptidase-like regulatory domain-containing protein [Candidatus Palauibacter sp.]|uniref:carboxypeptidase-like regulatory domain-containing protein n=1 Tax=Candidatus Palauibacter sp. TaxID=3101350 RepID=UPI003B5C967F
MDEGRGRITRRRVARLALPGTFFLLQLAGGFGRVAGQEEDCGVRASLQVAVLDESGLISIPYATVLLRWTAPDSVWSPVRLEIESSGRLFVCAPRTATEASLRAEFGDAASDLATVALEPGISREIELRLLVASVSDGRVVGSVLDALSERPVVAAAVSLAGRPQEAETDRRGGFLFDGVPIGDHWLSVRRLGYAPLRHRVTIARGATTEIEVGLVPDPVEMEPLVATAVRLRRLEIKGFYERKHWGELVSGGTFFTVADIERRNPLLISHMIAEEAGIRLRNCGLRITSCELHSTRLSTGFSGTGCPMPIFLDGIRVGTGRVDDWVRPVEIGGVEVYKGAASLPAEFLDFDSRCGAVAIWTK